MNMGARSFLKSLVIFRTTIIEVRESLRQRAQSESLIMLGSIQVHGFFPIDLARTIPGYRGMFPRC